MYNRSARGYSLEYSDVADNYDREVDKLAVRGGPADSHSDPGISRHRKMSFRKDIIGKSFSN